jgi:DNA-binding MarR family transcriptional regulator
MEYVLKNSMGYRINKVANAINIQLNKILAKYDIAVEQRATLEIIKFEKNVNQTMIAQLLGKDKTTISRSLLALEKKGLILKNNIQKDKRLKVIELTLKGEEILEQSQNEVNQFRAKLNASLKTHETLFFFNSLDKIAQTI